MVNECCGGVRGCVCECVWWVEMGRGAGGRGGGCLRVWLKADRESGACPWACDVLCVWARACVVGGGGGKGVV